MQEGFFLESGLCGLTLPNSTLARNINSERKSDEKAQVSAWNKTLPVMVYRKPVPYERLACF